MLAANLKHLFGPKLIDLCLKYDVKVDEQELLKKCKTHEQLCALISNDYRNLDRVFEFRKPFQNPHNDLDEQKEINSKEFNKNKRITSIIKILANKRLSDEAITIYLHHQRMVALRIESKRLASLKESERYAEQVAIYEAERAQAEEHLQQMLADELARSNKQIENAFSLIQAHRNKIEEIDSKIKELSVKHDQILEDYTKVITDKISNILPGLDKGVLNNKVSNYLKQHHELEKKIIDIEERQKLNNKQLSNDKQELKKLDAQIDELKLRYVNQANKNNSGKGKLTSQYQASLPISDKRIEQIRATDPDNQVNNELYLQIKAAQEQRKKLSESVAKRERMETMLSDLLGTAKKDQHELKENLIKECVQEANVPKEKVAEVTAQLNEVLSEQVVEMYEKEEFQQHRDLVGEKYEQVDQVQVQLDKAKENLNDKKEAESDLDTKLDQSQTKDMESYIDKTNETDDFLMQLMEQNEVQQEVSTMKAKGQDSP